MKQGSQLIIFLGENSNNISEYKLGLVSVNFYS